MESDRPLERRLVTSLFLDIVGSTDLMLRISPERLKRVLDEAFGDLSGVIAEHGGTVEKYIGDAIFAVFGVPTGRADDPLRALRAAEACAQLAEARSEDRVPFAVRIGVETGQVLVDLDAAETDRERMIVGPSVNLAARLQAAADPGHILVGPDCHEATANRAGFESVGELGLKGIGTVAAWRLLSTAGSAQVEPGFVGREEEFGRLQDALQHARAGRSVLALIIGPPGQGKSRLVGQFVAGLAEMPKLVARCRPEAEQGSLTPLKQLLADNSALPEPEVLLARLAELFPEPRERDRIAAALMHSAGLPGAPQPLPSNPIELQDEVLNGWKRYLSALGRRSLVLVWIEDLHWAEPQLLRLVDRLTVGSDTPLLVLGTARPELAGTTSLRPGPDRIFIELEPLGPTDAEELARQAGALGAASVSRAAGNPLFIVELARSRRATDEEIPVTLHAAIAARIDELPRQDREILQRAAVAGETFGLRDAALLAGRDPGEVSGALGRLVHAGYVIAVEQGYRFDHPLVHDVAYGRLSLAERMHLHARYAREGADPEDAEALAHHWWRALGEPDASWVWEDERELAHLRRAAYEAHLAAGRRHSARFAQERAVEVLERALTFGAGPADVAKVERELGMAYARNAQGDAAWEHRMLAIAACRDAGLTPPASLYAETVTIPVFNYAFTRSMPDEAVVMNVITEGQQVARSSGDEASLAMLLILEGYYVGDAGKAGTALELIDRASDPLPYADTLARLATVQMLAGDVAASDENYRRVEALFDAGATIDELEYLAYRVTSQLLLARIDEATAGAERFLALSEAMGAHLRTHALQPRCSIAMATGDWALAASMGQETAEVVEANPETPFCIRGAMATAQGAVAALVQGDRQTAEDLVALTERMIKPGLQRAYAMFLPSVMLGRPADPAEAMPLPGTITRPWQRQLVDPGYLNLAVGVVIGDRTEARPRALEHLRVFGKNGSLTASALAEAVGGDTESLRAMGFIGLVELLSWSSRR
ncbi:MAG: adenylate/guanylate cyclase domain-containing protein [Chloroflexota bacterium]